MRRAESFSSSLAVPRSIVPYILGKRGANLRRLKAKAGISELEIIDGDITSSVQVKGVSEYFVVQILKEIRNTVIESIDKNRDFVPSTIVICFQATFNNSRNEVSLVRVMNNHPPKSPWDFDLDKHKYLWKPAEDGAAAPSNAPRFSTTSKVPCEAMAVPGEMTKIYYAQQLVECLRGIRSSGSSRSRLILEVKIGKLLFFLQPQDVVWPSFNVKQLGRARYRFYDDVLTSDDVAKLQNTLISRGYSSLPCTRKVSLHLVDLLLVTKHNISICLEDSSEIREFIHSHGKDRFKDVLQNPDDEVCPTNGEELVPCFRNISFRGKPKRHAFFMNLHEEKMADLRLSVLTREEDPCPQEELLQCVERAWSERAGPGKLMFDPDGRFQAASVRFKETNRFVLGDYMAKVVKVVMRDNCKEVTSCEWEVTLKSKWLKENLSSASDFRRSTEEASVDYVQGMLHEGNCIVKSISELSLDSFALML